MYQWNLFTKYILFSSTLYFSFLIRVLRLVHGKLDWNMPRNWSCFWRIQLITCTHKQPWSVLLLCLEEAEWINKDSPAWSLENWCENLELSAFPSCYSKREAPACLSGSTGSSVESSGDGSSGDGDESEVNAVFIQISLHFSCQKSEHFLTFLVPIY